MSVSPLSAPEGRADSRPPQAPATVAHLMRPATKTVAEGDHAAAATYLMRRARTTSLVVLDFQADKPVAIITAADIARAVAEGKDLNEIHIHDLLTTRPAPISAATPVRRGGDRTAEPGRTEACPWAAARGCHPRSCRAPGRPHPVVHHVDPPCGSRPPQRTSSQACAASGSAASRVTSIGSRPRLPAYGRLPKVPSTLSPLAT